MLGSSWTGSAFWKDAFLKPVEGLSTKDTKEIHKGDPRRARREKELSTKGHEGVGEGRGWRRLKRDPPKVAKGRKDFHEKAKRYPRRATKNGEGPLRGWRKLKRDPPKVGKGEKISTKGDKGSVKRAKDESAKGLQGVGKDSKGVREGPLRGWRRLKRDPPKVGKGEKNSRRMKYPSRG